MPKAAKIYQPGGKNFSVGAADYHNDGWTDIFVANDGLYAYLYPNQHDGRFEEVGVSAGMAVAGDGQIMPGHVYLAGATMTTGMPGSFWWGQE